MYKTLRVEIKDTHPLYAYCSDVCHAANNLYNAVLFRIRQTMTGLQKLECLPQSITSNEQEVLNELKDFTNCNPSYRMPTAKKWFLPYGMLNRLLYDNNNVDYFAQHLPRHTAQQTIKQAVQDMKGYCKSCKAYAKNKQAFTGAPRLPGYKKPGGICTASLSNQECVVKEQDDLYFVKLPRTKEVCQITTSVGRLKFVTIKPYFNVFYISFVFEIPNAFEPIEQDDNNERIIFDKPERCIAIDFGIDNLAAISNNFGHKGLLIKGGIVKSKNQWFNKLNAQMQCAKDQGVLLDLYQKNWVNRNNFMRDVMHKYADYIIKYALDHHVDTIILGSTKGWKQSSKMNKKNNQSFVGIPFDLLKKFIAYRAVQHGINILYQEESFTSQASFKYKDDIPVYGELSEEEYDALKFSGRRIKRGLYCNKDGSVVNADLNAAANIGRKALPDLFTQVNFERPDILTNIFNM